MRGPVRGRDALLTAGAVVLLSGGMSLTVAGVVVPGLFVPGVVVIALGLLGTAAAAALRLLAPGRG